MQQEEEMKNTIHEEEVIQDSVDEYIHKRLAQNLTAKGTREKTLLALTSTENADPIEEAYQVMLSHIEENVKVSDDLSIPVINITKLTEEETMTIDYFKNITVLFPAQIEDYTCNKWENAWLKYVMGSMSDNSNQIDALDFATTVIVSTPYTNKAKEQDRPELKLYKPLHTTKNQVTQTIFTDNNNTTQDKIPQTIMDMLQSDEKCKAVLEDAGIWHDIMGPEGIAAVTDKRATTREYIKLLNLREESCFNDNYDYEDEDMFKMVPGSDFERIFNAIQSAEQETVEDDMLQQLQEMTAGDSTMLQTLQQLGMTMNPQRDTEANSDDDEDENYGSPQSIPPPDHIEITHNNNNNNDDISNITELAEALLQQANRNLAPEE